MKTVLLCT